MHWRVVTRVCPKIASFIDRIGTSVTPPLPLSVEGMPEILIRCPNLGRIVPTGLTTEKIKLSSLSDLKLRLLCPACLKWHRWGQKEAWIYDFGELQRFKISL